MLNISRARLYNTNLGRRASLSEYELAWVLSCGVGRSTLVDIAGCGSQVSCEDPHERSFDVISSSIGGTSETEAFGQ